MKNRYLDIDKLHLVLALNKDDVSSKQSNQLLNKFDKDKSG